MERIDRELFRLTALGGFINAYLWNGDTLMDTGAPWVSRLFLRELRLAGHQPSTIGNVLLSHCHVDHAGGLLELPQPLTVYGGAHDIEVLEGRHAPPSYHPRFGPLVEAAERLLPRARLAADHRTGKLGNGDTALGWTAVSVPGHTPGSMVWYQRDTRTVFVGDLLIHHFGWLQGPAPLFSEDYETAVQSLAKLQELEIETVLFGHGRVLRRHAERKLAALTRRLQARQLPLVETGS